MGRGERERGGKREREKSWFKNRKALESAIPSQRRPNLLWNLFQPVE